MPRRPPLPGRTFAGLELSHPSNKGLVVEFACAPGRFGGAALFDLKANRKGALNGGVTWKPTGRAGGYGQLNFGGVDGYVNAGAADVLNFTGDFTLAGWFYVLDLATPYVFAAKRNAPNSYPYAWLYRAANSEIELFTDAGSGGVSVGTGAAPPQAKLFHAAVARRGTTITFFRDGRQDGSPATLAAGSANTANLLIGAQDAGSGLLQFLNGPADGFMGWSRGLSLSDYQAVYDQTRRRNPDRWRWLSRATWLLPTGGGGNSLTRTAADAPSTADAATRVFTGTRTASDGPTTADAVVRTLMLFRTAADSPSTADAAARVFVGHRTASDAPATADAGAASKTFIRTAADNPATADSASAMRTYLRTVMDAPVTLDAAVRAFTGFRTATDHPLTADTAFASVVGPQQPPSEIIYLSWMSGTPILASWSPGTPIMLFWQA